MKKTLLISAAISLLSISIIAQSNSTGTKYNRCGTQTPTKEWDEAFNKLVEKHKQDLATSRTTATSYTIPVIFHIIYSTGEVEGAAGSHNISQAQVNSQIPILNADYAGTGYNTNQYASMSIAGNGPFYDYAVANSLPAPDANGTVIANTGITFWLATKDTNGVTLAEPGIHRVAWESIVGATDPAISTITTLFDGTIKPATIWNPAKYFNVWVSDGGSSGIIGYSTLPSGTALTGISGGGGSTTASDSTDGVWIAYNALGNTGVAAAPYNYGRSLTHESGHYFGLRHVWGDGACLTDYCNDTPPASAANYIAWPTTYPYLPNSCTGTPPNGNGPDGDMFMNFMDYSDDAAMWMFTNDQVTRITTAMTQCPNLSGLTASAISMGSPCATAPVVTYTLTPDTAPHVWDASTVYSANVTSAKWYWGDGTDTIALYPSHTYSVAGRYTICVAAYSSCGDSAVSCQSDTVYRSSATTSSIIEVKVLQSTTGIKQLASSNYQVAVYPNPNNGTFTIKLNDYDNTTVEVYNTIGQRVFSQVLQTNLTQLSLAGFSNGMYQVRLLKGGNSVYQTKVVKQE